MIKHQNSTITVAVAFEPAWPQAFPACVLIPPPSQLTYGPYHLACRFYHRTLIEKKLNLILEKTKNFNIYRLVAGVGGGTPLANLSDL